MSFRKERKFRLTSGDSNLLLSDLLNDGMTTLYPDRRIISQYFDTPDLRCFEESEEGVLPRRKYRIRWYDGNKNDLSFEMKVSSVEGRYKETHPLSASKFDEAFQQGLTSTDYGILYPSVEVQYTRSYYSYKNLRITFDREIEYIFDDNSSRYFDFEQVVEVKFPVHISEDYLERLFRFPTARFSKYCRAFLAKSHRL